MRVLATSVTKFATVFLCCTILSTFLWEMCVNNTLYNCTDPGFLEYLSPGDWVHGRVESVAQVVSGRSMNDPDTIQEGWTITGLWFVWASFVGVSLIVSISLARVPWKSAAYKP